MYKIEVKGEEMGSESGEEEDGEEKTESDSINRQCVTLSCVGVGFSNYSKGMKWSNW